MGQSVLKVHSLGSDRYCPYGFFAETNPKDDFQRPISDRDILNAFRKDFHLKRVQEPGLSIVVPYPDIEEINQDQMLRSAILHYFYPILCGELVVEVATHSNETVVDSHSIDQIADSTDWDDTGATAAQLKRLFSLVRRAIAIDEAELLKLPEPPARSPDWNVGRFTEPTVLAMKRQFQKNGMLAVRVPLTVKPKKEFPHAAFFDVFVERDAQLSKAEDHYIRQGITISKIAALKEKGFRGIVVVSDDKLSALLGDSENPAHTEWLEKSTKLKDRFEWGTFTVRFVRNAIQRIVAQLLYVPEGRDEQLLKNLFYLEEPLDVGRELAKRKKHKDLDPEEDSEEEIEIAAGAKTSLFRVQKIAGGFRIGRNPKATVTPQHIAIEVAYEVRRGNAFKKYETFDFQLQEKPIVITNVGASFLANANRLDVQPSDDPFLVEVTGFDPHRDLAVRALTKKNEASDAEEV